MVHYFIQLNFATVVLALCMLVFIHTNRIMDRKAVSMFSTASVLVLMLVLADSVEYWTATWAEPSLLRIFVSAVGYSLRPCIIYMMVAYIGRKQKISWFLLRLPMYVNVLISFSAFFSGIAFSYDAQNQFVRGPLGYSPFVACAIYLILLMWVTVRAYRSGNRTEPAITLFVILVTVVATCMESMFGYDGVINVSGVISITFFYMYTNIQMFKRDVMTGAFNRRSLYADVKRNVNRITGIISVDLNHLKRLNDQEGHAVGDDAICSIAACIMECLGQDCFVYRMGGDEFVILGFGPGKEQFLGIMREIREKTRKTRYSCAMGLAMAGEAPDFEELCKLADRRMYENKAQMKRDEGDCTTR